METSPQRELIPTTIGELTYGESLIYEGVFWQYMGRCIVDEVEIARIANGPYLRNELDIELSTPVEKVIYK